MNPDTVDLLNEALSLEMASFFIYLQEVACPEFTEEEQPIRDAFERIASQEREFAGTIADMIEAAGGHPEPRGFPMADQQYHFVRAEYLLPICVAKIKESIERFDAITTLFRSDPEIHPALERIARAKGMHIASIEKFTKKKAAPVAAQAAEAVADDAGSGETPS